MTEADLPAAGSSSRDAMLGITASVAIIPRNKRSHCSIWPGGRLFSFHLKKFATVYNTKALMTTQRIGPYTWEEIERAALQLGATAV